MGLSLVNNKYLLKYISYIDCNVLPNQLMPHRHMFPFAGLSIETILIAES